MGPVHGRSHLHDVVAVMHTPFNEQSRAVPHAAAPATLKNIAIAAITSKVQQVSDVTVALM